MKVVRYYKKGPPHVLTVEDLPLPIPGEGEALVRIEASGIAYGHVLQRSGRHYPIPVTLPAVPSGVVAGVVEAVGPGGDAQLVGARIYGFSQAAYAEYATVAISSSVQLPDAVSAVDAVAVLSDGVTASMILKYAGRLEPGESVFVPAAAGGLGFVAVQLARIYGARKVFGAASSPEKRELVVDLGADAAIDYTQTGWAKQVLAENGEEGVDLALETTGGPIFYETLDIVKPGGRIVNYGNASDTDSPVNPRALLRKSLTLSGYLGTHYARFQPAAVAEVLRLLEDGKLQAQFQIYPLVEAHRAHEMIETRKSVGRQILVP